MKTRSIVFYALLCASAVSCSKEIVGTEASQPGKTIVKVALDATKTYIGPSDDTGARKVYWSEGDAININGVASTPLSGIEPMTGEASFEFEGLLSFPYNVIYPASAYKDATTITLPSVQPFAEGTFGAGASPAIAFVGNAAAGLRLKNLCSVVKVSIAAGSDTDKIRSVSFSGNAGEQVCGDFTVDFEKAAVTAVSGAKTVTVSPIGMAIGAAPLDVHIVVPSGEYAQGFKVKVTDENGHFMEVKKSSAVTLSPGKVAAMPEFTFAPTGTSVDIYTTADLQTFATALKAGTFGTGTDLTVNVCADLDFGGAEPSYLPIDNNAVKFGGVFDGNGYSWKNLKMTNRALFYTPAGATLRNIVIDASVTAVKNASGSANWGLVTRTISAGTVENCTVNCDYNIDYGSVPSECGVGTVVGRADGAATVRGCVMNGDFVYTRASATKPSGSLCHIGGVVGYVMAQTGLVENCVMNGNYHFNEPSDEYKPTVEISASGYNHNWSYGGVVGGTAGTVRGCEMNGRFEFYEYTAGPMIGGVVGDVAKTGIVEDCHIKNDVIIDNHKSNNTQYSHFYAGGVVGRNQNIVRNCTSKAGTTQYFSTGANASAYGGVVGSTQNNTACILGGCTNNATINQDTMGGLTMYVGGVCGQVAAGVFESGWNNGPINVDYYNHATTSAQTFVGGVAGRCTADLNGGAITCKVAENFHNTAQICTKATDECAGFSRVGFGGIVGRMEGNAANLTNGGKVFLNYGDQAAHSNQPMKYISAGGVIGSLLTAKTIDGCINNGVVQIRYYTTTGNNNGKVTYIGGVLGSALNAANKTGVAATIRNCVNYALVSTSTNNTTYPSGGTVTQGKCEGGVIGIAMGVQDTGLITVENCHSYASEYSISCGYFGGVIGYLMHGTATGCTCSTTLTGQAKATSGNGVTLGGIVAYSTYCHINGCTFTGKLKDFASGGGISAACNNAYAFIENNTVNGVFSSVYTSAAFGAVARNPIATTTVQGNGIKGSYNDRVFKSGEYEPYTGTGTFTCAPDKPNFVME